MTSPGLGIEPGDVPLFGGDYKLKLKSSMNGRDDEMEYVKIFYFVGYHPDNHKI